MSESVWDDPEIRSGGDFIKLEKEGDYAAGNITAIRRHKFDPGKVVPQILLVTDEGEERTLTAGQVRLKAELAEQRPEAGDHIKVTLTRIEPRAGGKSLKHFEVVITRGGKAGVVGEVTPTTPTPAGTAAVDPALAAALAALSPEERAQLGIAS